MEYLDVVDNNDLVVGNASKEDVYKQLLPHRIVHILVYNDKGEMAVQVRGKNVTFCPEHWCTSAAGHVQTGESYERAAARELEEELGIKSTLNFIDKFFYHADDRPDKFIAVFETFHTGPLKLDPDEVGACSYFDKSKIGQMVSAGEKFHPEFLFILDKLNLINSL